MRGGGAVPPLGRVEDIHAVTGLLKDFLRNLKEPLLTCRLNRAFMEAAGEAWGGCGHHWAGHSVKLFLIGRFHLYFEMINDWGAFFPVLFVMLPT